MKESNDSEYSNSLTTARECQGCGYERVLCLQEGQCFLRLLEKHSKHLSKDKGGEQ